nr:helix-turn-helix transcriptional regulator [Sphingomonas sp. TDK1]
MHSTLPESWPQGWHVAATILRDRRESLGMSLDTLAERTRVGRNHLEAIESARFDRCGAPIYAVGFARAVARALELSEAPIVTAIRDGNAAHGPAAAPPGRAVRRRTIPNLGIATTAAMLASLLSDVRS